MFLAHVAGMPVEEALLPLVGGASAAMVLARAWLGSRLRPERQRRLPTTRKAEGR
jgi:hypothetical protein